jgi:hypothetical protein
VAHHAAGRKDEQTYLGHSGCSIMVQHADVAIRVVETAGLKTLFAIGMFMKRCHERAQPMPGEQSTDTQRFYGMSFQDCRPVFPAPRLLLLSPRFLFVQQAGPRGFCGEEVVVRVREEEECCAEVAVMGGRCSQVLGDLPEKMPGVGGLPRSPKTFVR